MTSPPVSTQIALPLEPGVARQRLSKSRFVAGKQCHRLLWWKVHEPLAVELQPDKVLQDRFDQGAQVGALARERFPGGVLIEATTADSPADSSGASHPRNDMGDARSRNDMRAEQVERTRRAIDAGESVIFEASFVADNTFVAVDVLLREVAGWRLIEVKSASSQKEEHLLDV